MQLPTLIGICFASWLRMKKLSIKYPEDPKQFDWILTQQYFSSSLNEGFNAARTLAEHNKKYFPRIYKRKFHASKEEIFALLESTKPEKPDYPLPISVYNITLEQIAYLYKHSKEYDVQGILMDPLIGTPEQFSYGEKKKIISNLMSGILPGIQKEFDSYLHRFFRADQDATKKCFTEQPLLKLFGTLVAAESTSVEDLIKEYMTYINKDKNFDQVMDFIINEYQWEGF